MHHNLSQSKALNSSQIIDDNMFEPTNIIADFQTMK
jgi:hypothetical protein